MIAALLGLLLGTLAIAALQAGGLLRDRAGAAVLLIAVASYYPVFAAAGGDPLATGLHVAIFAGFSALAVRAFARGLFLLAGGLIAHGLFNIMIGFINAPGPAWWPAFVAGFDIAAGVVILRLIQQGRLPR